MDVLAGEKLSHDIIGRFFGPTRFYPGLGFIGGCRRIGSPWPGLRGADRLATRSRSGLGARQIFGQTDFFLRGHFVVVFGRRVFAGGHLSDIFLEAVHRGRGEVAEQGDETGPTVCEFNGVMGDDDMSMARGAGAAADDRRRGRRDDGGGHVGRHGFEQKTRRAGTLELDGFVDDSGGVGGGSALEAVAAKHTHRLRR